MQARQRKGCSPRPSLRCSPAQTRFQVPSALESTLQAIQDPSTCLFLLCDPVTCAHRSYVTCRAQPCIPLLATAERLSLSSASILGCCFTLVIPTDAPASLLGDKRVSCRRPAERQNHGTAFALGRMDKITAQKTPNPGQRYPPHAAGKRRHHRHAEGSELRLGSVRFLVPHELGMYELGALRPPPTRPTGVWPVSILRRAHNHKPAKSVLRMLTHLAESPTEVKFRLQAEH